MLASPAWADERPATVSGRVIDLLGQPVAGVNVHVVSSAGGDDTVVQTDKNGRYRVGLAGGTYSLVFALNGASAQKTITVELGGTRVVDAELDLGGGEIIKIRDLPPAAVLPKPRKDVRVLPKYSDAAILHDVWVRAWVLLDISATGDVTRVKFLKRPGYDLDNHALRYAFGLKFEPARDHQNQAVRNLLVYSIEWPSKEWLNTHQLLMRTSKVDTDLQDPEPAMEKVPCAGSGPWRFGSGYLGYRDCSQPDLTKVDTQPWITRRKR